MNTKYRQDASIAVLRKLESGDLDESAVKSFIYRYEGYKTHTIDYRIQRGVAGMVKAMLAEEIKRHGEEGKWSKEWCVEKAKAENGHEVGVGFETSDILTKPNWITWNGGECPVSPNTVVEVELREGDKYEAPAECFDWSLPKYHNLRVKQYRVVEG